MARADTATVAGRYRVWVGTTVLRIAVRFGRLRARGGEPDATNLAVDAELGVNPATRRRVAGPVRERASQRPVRRRPPRRSRTITDDKVEALIVKTLETEAGFTSIRPNARWCVRGREIPDPGAQPVPADPVDDARHPGAAQPRLRAPRDYQLVRRPRLDIQRARPGKKLTEKPRQP